MRSDYWEQHAESIGWHIGNVNEFQLHCDGDYLEGWYPKWAKPQPIETDSTLCPSQSVAERKLLQ